MWSLSQEVLLCSLQQSQPVFSIEYSHWSTDVLTVYMGVRSICIVEARWIFTLIREASRATRNSRFVNDFIGAKRTLPIKKARSTMTVWSVTIFPQRQATALKTFWELSPNTYISKQWASCLNQLLGKTMELNEGNSSLHSKTWCAMSSGNSTSYLRLLRRQLSFSSKQAFTV